MRARVACGNIAAPSCPNGNCREPISATKPANWILVLAALFAALVLAFVVHGHERFLTTPGRAAFFVGLPAGGLAAFLAAFRLRPESRIAAAITTPRGLLGSNGSIARHSNCVNPCRISQAPTVWKLESLPGCSANPFYEFTAYGRAAGWPACRKRAFPTNMMDRRKDGC